MQELVILGCLGTQSLWAICHYSKEEKEEHEVQNVCDIQGFSLLVFQLLFVCFLRRQNVFPGQRVSRALQDSRHYAKVAVQSSIVPMLEAA